MANQDPNAAQNPPGNSQPIIAEHVNVGDIQNRGPIHQLNVHGNFYNIGNQPRPEVAHDSAEHLSNIEASWQEKSQEAADKVIGTLPSNPVPLDIIRDSQAPLEEFGLKGLKRLREKQVNSTMLELNQLFAAAKQEAIDEAKSKKFRNKAANDDYVERHGNVVGMTGIAGIGKTTAIIQTLSELVDELPADQKGYRLFKYLKTLDLNKSLGVLELLSSNPNWKHTKEIDDQILEKLSKSNKLFIFLDGLDEPRFKDLDLDAPVIGLYDRATPVVILQNLLRGDILPNAHKLLTSRPGAFLKLHPSCKPHFVVKVIGFNESSQDLYFRQICPEKEEYEKVTKSLGQNPHAKALCFLPMFAKTVAPYIIKHGTKDGNFTLTDVFAAFVADCIRSPKFKEHPRILRKLSDLALHGMLNDKIMFDEEVFDEVGLNSEKMEDFLNMQVFSSDLNLRILEGDKVFFFIHLLWQEFFTSLKLLFDTDLATFSGLLQSMETNTWEMVLRFLFGLLNTGLHLKLKPIFKISSTDVASKKSLLKGLIDSLGSQLLSNDDKSFNCDLFKLCSLAQESNDEEITAKVADSLPVKLHIKGGTILPSEVSSLCHVLRATQRELVINIGVNYSVTFTGNGLEMLMETMAHTKHTMEFVHVTTTGSRDFTALSTCVHKMNRLLLCNTSDVSGFEVLTEAIARRETPMDEVSVTTTGSRVFTALSTCVHKINHLVLDNTSDLSGFEVLTKAIARRETPMEELFVDKLGSRELSCLATSATNINKLTLLYCDTAGSNLQALTDAISRRTHPLEKLNLRWNKLDSRGLSCLATSVNNINQLELWKCKIAGSDLQPLTDAISRMDRPLEKLHLGCNKMDSRGLSCLATSVHNINQLELLDCEIAGSDLQPLTDAISRMGRPLEKLSLSYSKMDSRAFGCLATSVHNINQLDLCVDKIAGSDLQPLTDAISRMDRPLEKLNLSCNKLDLLGVSCLATSVHNINQLELTYCEITGSYLHPLTDAISRMDRPMRKLDLRFNELGSQGLAFLRTCAHNVQELELELCGIGEADVDSLRKLYQDKQAEPEASQSQGTYTGQDLDDETDHQYAEPESSATNMEASTEPETSRVQEHDFNQQQVSDEIRPSEQRSARRRRRRQ